MSGKPLVYFDSAATALKPQVVIDAEIEYYTSYTSNIHRGVYELSQHATDAFENVRQIIADFLHAPSSDTIVFTKSATEAMNLVASSFAQAYLTTGDEVLITAMEHHANIIPWQLACERYGAVLKVLPVTMDGELDWDNLPSLISDKTKIIAMAHISNVLGTVNNVAKMTSIAHERNIPVIIDGSQAAPHIAIDVQALDCEFYVFTGHKAFGPTGVGVLYGKKEWLDALPPYQGGGDMIEQVTFEKSTFKKAPAKFEAGTPNIAGVIGLGAALKWFKSLTIVEIE